MMSRCYNPKDLGYANYGGRGIAVCDRWRFGEDGKPGFECYLADLDAVIGPRQSPHYTLDRIDNDGNYELGNMRWATRSGQSYNRRHPREQVTGIRLRRELAGVMFNDNGGVHLRKDRRK